MSDLTLRDLWRVLIALTGEGAHASEQGDLETARERARLILSAAAKLHQRLAILVDMRRSGEWTAEVDRAISRRAEEIPGQQSFSDAPRPTSSGRRTKKLK